MPRKPKYVTICRTCGDVVGVWYTPYNRDRGAHIAAVPKTSRHHDRAGRPCPGGLLSIDPNTMFPNVEVEVA